MGGKVLDLPEFILYDKGVADGIEKGTENGKITARFEDGMTIDEIAERTHVSVEVVKTVLRDAGMLKE